MKKIFVFIVLLSVSVAVHAQSPVDSTEIKFDGLIEQTGMVFNKPTGSVSTPIVKNRQIHYDYAVSYPDKNMEIRYTIVPMANQVKKYQEFQKNHAAGSWMIDPNKMLNGLIYATIINAGGGMPDSTIRGRMFAPTDVKREFGADAGGFFMVPVKNNSFGTDYKFCSMVALQKDNVANVYIFYLCNSMKELFDNYQAIGPQNIYYALKFKN